jgi:phosphomannomutase
MTDEDRLVGIFHAYDVRGVVPDELDARIAWVIGYAFAKFAASDAGAPTKVLVGRDMRASGEELGAALLAGAFAAGATVVDLGLCSTDLCYFASGYLDAAAAMLTASHNPARYNGVKFCLPGARPVGEESGLLAVRQLAVEALTLAPEHLETPPDVEQVRLLDAFAAHVHSFVDLDELAPLFVIADTANGMGGLVAPRVFAGLPFHLEVLYGDLDGSFPHHPADPIQPENLRDLQALLLEQHADVGLAFDGDADRVFLVDETGSPLSGSTTTAIVAKAILEKHPGATILYNVICSKTVREVIAESGGVGIRTRVGHSFIKSVMAETGALFGGEHSGHYYFADNYRADSGIIAALVVLETLSKAGGTLSELRRPFERYAVSGEINSTVHDAAGVIATLRERALAAGAQIDELDGLTADYGSWWFNLRSSNTEPLLRLNLEAQDAATLAARTDEVLAVIRAGT